MPADTVLQRLRTWLFILSGLMFGAVLIELILTEHTESAVQWIPFVLAGLALAVLVAVLIRPQRTILRALRAVMALVILGALVGVFQHLQGNLLFELDIRPGTTVGAVLWDALKGAAPLLAPGIMAMAAIVALSGTYEHPALDKTPQPVPAHLTGQAGPVSSR
jgi:hypothetical protein